MKYRFLICLLFVHLFGTEIESLSILSRKSKTKKPSATKKGGLLSPLTKLLTLTPSKPDVDDDKSSVSSGGGFASTVKDSTVIPPAPTIQADFIDKPLLPLVLRSEVKSEANIDDAIPSTPAVESTGLFVPAPKTKVPSVATTTGGLLSPLTKLLTLAPSKLDVDDDKSSVTSGGGFESTVEQDLQVTNSKLEGKGPQNIPPQGVELPIDHLKDMKLQDTVSHNPDKESIHLDNFVPFVLDVEPMVNMDEEKQNNIQEKVESVDKQYLDLQNVQLQNVGLELHDVQVQHTQNVEPLDLELQNVGIENEGMKNDAGQTEILQNVKLQDTLLQDLLPSVLDSRSIVSSLPEQGNFVQSNAESIVDTRRSPSSDLETLAAVVAPIISTVTDIEPASSFEPVLKSIIPYVTDPSIQNIESELSSIPDVPISDASLLNDHKTLAIAPDVQPDIDLEFPTVISENLALGETSVNLPDARNISSPIGSTKLPGITKLLSILTGGLKDVLSNLMNALTSTPGLKELLIYLLSILDAILTLISRMTGAENIISSIRELTPLLNGLLYLPEIFNGVLNNVVSSSRETYTYLSILQLSDPEGLTALLNFVLNVLNDLLSAIPDLLKGIPLDNILPDLIGTLGRILPNLSLNLQHQTDTNGIFQYPVRGPLIDIQHQEINLIHVFLDREGNFLNVKYLF